MVNKKEFFGTLIIGLIGGYAFGYTKAREKFLQALIKAGANYEDIVNEKTES